MEDEAVRAVREFALHALGNGTSAGERLPAAAHPAVAERSVHVKDHVSDLAAVAGHAAHEASVRDHARADACAHADVEHVAHADAGPEEPFRQTGRIGVVVEEGAHAERVG